MSPQNAPAPRIASLVPSATELLVALGLLPYLVARTGFCIHPAAALAAVPKVGGTKDVNLARLRALTPSHVLVNRDENRLETAQALHEFVPTVVDTHPCTVEDNLALLTQLEGVFGHLPGVLQNAQALRESLLAELALTQPSHWPPEPVLYLIWQDPWMTVARDTYLSSMLARVNWLTEPAVWGGPLGAARYPVLTGSEPGLGRVRQVLLSSEPYRFEARHIEAAQALCPQAQVRLVDGELLSWWGARAIPGLRYLRSLRTD